MSDTSQFELSLLAIVQVFLVFALREGTYLVWRRHSGAMGKPLGDEVLQALTARTLFFSFALSIVGLHLAFVFGVLPSWWRWWITPIAACVVVALSSVAIYAACRWWNHPRLLVRLRAYLLLLGILVTCSWLGTLIAEL